MPLGARGRIIPAVAAPSAAGPNAPTLGVNGWTLLRETPFAVNMAQQTVLGAYNSEGWRYAQNDNPNTCVIVDTDGPTSPPGAFRMYWPAGTAGGGGPCVIESQSFPSPVACLYRRTRFRIMPGYDHGGNGGEKLYYIPKVGDPFGPNPHYLAFDSGIYGRFRSALYWGQNNRSWNGYTSTEVVHGQWQDLEVLMVAESVAGGNDGKIRIWLNGNPVSWLTQSGWGSNTPETHGFFTAGQTPRWTGLRFNSTYGGGLNPVPINQWWDIDHDYAMGSTVVGGGIV